MKKILFLAAAIFVTVCGYAQNSFRNTGWTGDVGIDASFVPSVIKNESGQQLQFSLNGGYNVTQWLYVGAGASWISYFEGSDALPLYVNPRVYFSKYENSLFVDTRFGIVVYAPEKTVDGDRIHATCPGPYIDMSIGYAFNRFRVGLGANFYVEDNETQVESWGHGGGPTGAFYLRFSYSFK